MVKILVTGGAGFIGSEFIREAILDYELAIVDNLSYAGDMQRIEEFKDKISFYDVDITDKSGLIEVFNLEKPDVVVHWAAETHVDRSILDSSPFINSNIIGTQNLLDISKEHGVSKFINIATDEVYGDLGDDGYFYENSILNPSSPYSVSKASADMLGRSYFRTFGLSVITVRPSNNYGPWQYPEKLIPVVILKAFADEKIPVYGSGDNVREWLYVSDCVKAVLKLIDKGEPGEIYNVGSGEERRNIDVVKSILKFMGKSEDLIEFVKDRPGHDYRYSLSVEKIKNDIGWEPEIMFEEGMEKVVKWYLENMDWTLKKKDELLDYWDKVYKK